MLGLVIIYSFAKGLIWKFISRTGFKEFLIRLSWRYLILTLGIMVSFILLFYTASKIFGQTFFPIFVVFIMSPFFLHFTLISHPMIVIKKRFALGTSFAVAIKKIHHLLLPYLLILAVFGFLAIILKICSYLPGRAFPLLALLLLILFMNWSKYYLYLVLKPLSR